MQLRDAFPAGTCTGGDFVTGRYEVNPGERVVDLDCDLDALPAWGRLCLHENTVRLMVTTLGWDFDPALTERAKELQVENTRLRRENKRMREALGTVVEAASEVGMKASA